MECNDIVTKDFESYPDVAADIINALVHGGSISFGKPDDDGQAYTVQIGRIPKEAWKYIDDIRLHVWELRRLPGEVRGRFKSDMRIVLDYLAEGESYRTDQKVVHKEALINMLRVLSGDENLANTKIFMEEMNIREEDEITMCELFDQYVKQGKEQGQLMAAKNMKKELNLTAEQALRIAGIPREKWSKYEGRLA